MVTRWATFDCYGTLIDWNGGIRDRAHPRLRRRLRRRRLLERYHALERELERDGSRQLSRGDDRGDAPTRRARRRGRRARRVAAELAALPRGRPSLLAELRQRGWRLAILSNSDRDLIAASKELLGVEFDETVVASEIHSYKPALGSLGRVLRADARRPAPARPRRREPLPRHRACRRLGLPSVWINRLGEHAAALADGRAAPTSAGLPDALDGLIP